MSIAEVLQEEAAAPPLKMDTPSPASPGKGETYGQILKSSAIVGGSSAINIGIGIARTKAMALLLGPAGYGLFGLYTSIVSLTQTFAGMGVNSSGVRQIAEAAGTADARRIAHTSLVLQRVSVLLGLIGATFLLVFSGLTSRLTFGTTQQAGAIRVLAVAVFFTLVAAGQGALIQGLRRMGDLSRVAVVGTTCGSVLSVLLVYIYRDRGIAPALVSVAMMTCLASWWYSRRIQLPAASITAAEMLGQSVPLLKLGFTFMASGLMTLGVAYVVRLALLRQVGTAATGLYQSSWTLGGLYVGIILQAMGADFYPRLTASANDNPTCNRLVNEQTQIGLLLAAPGILATLTFAPLVITLFYSAKFGPAVEVLRWICLGSLLQIITWPMGFIIVAKAKQGIFFACETSWAIVSLALAWACIRHFGLVGAGIAFFGSYLFHGLLLYPIVASLSGFSWSSVNQRLGLIYLAVVAIVFAGFYLLPFRWAVTLGVLATASTAFSSLRLVLRLVGSERLSPALLSALRFGRLLPSTANS